MLKLLDAGLLSYIVGGPWRAAKLQRICLANNTPPEETASLYRDTKIIVNVFRDQHHFNRNGILGWSLNPRVYEALACGALVVSERRPEVERTFPALPTFTDAHQLVERVQSLLLSNSMRTAVLAQCQASLPNHTYAQRLRQVLNIIPSQVIENGARVVSKSDAIAATENEQASELVPGWCLIGEVATIAPAGHIILSTPDCTGAGSELGIASTQPYADLTLSFELKLEGNAWFVAKLHQLDQRDQATNSYHLICNNTGAYVAVHDHVFRRMLVPRARWVALEMSWRQGALRLVINGRSLPEIHDDRMPMGYCFLGLKSGRVSLRNLTLNGDAVRPGNQPGVVTVLGANEFPTVAGFSVLDQTAIVSERNYTDVELAFEASLDADATLIAKLHQQDRIDLSSNSYHLVARPEGAYFAKHNVVLSTLLVPHEVWCGVRIKRVQRTIELSINEQTAFRGMDDELTSGFCLLGVSQGHVRLRNIHVTDLKAPAILDTRPVLKGSEPDYPFNENLHTSGFTAMPRRNLIYHIWPVAGSLWEWNVDQLRQRIDLFNGRRIIGVVNDSKSVSSQAVMSELEGHGCEFVALQNQDSGEVVTFAEMLRQIASHDPNEITFYGHAKGVKYGANVSDAVRRWTEVLYRVTLDDWRSVWTQLKDRTLTGPFRMLGRFAAHRNVGNWHYSGSFFWMRHASVFARRDLEVPQFYGGVEAWPGKHFRISETGCLFLDNLRQLPYQPTFWQTLGEPALTRWEAALRTFPPPSDLEHPVLFAGFAWPRLEQKPDEMSWYLAQLLSAGVRKLLTIGARHGGLEWHVARVFREQQRDIEITTIEIEPGHDLNIAFSDARERFGQSIHLVHANSTSSDIQQKLNGTYDAAFIDGDHSYRAALSDWLLARSMGARFIAFHDIVDLHWHAATRCCVSRLWTEIKADHTTEERASGDWGGIGVVRV